MQISAGKDGHLLHGGFVFGFALKLFFVGVLAAVIVATAHDGTAHAQAPVAAYSFDEGSGGTVMDSAGDHDGMIKGATWESSGKYGSALDFDGESDLVSIADAADLDLTESFTLEAWVRPDVAANWEAVISKGEVIEGTNAGYLLLAQSEGGKPRGYAAGTAVKAVTSPTALSAEAWSHLAFTSDGTTLRLYIDGDEVASSEAVVAKATKADLEIGHWSLLNTYFDGLIDEVRIYSGELDEDEIEVDMDTAVGLREVTATPLDTGPNSELVSSVPITDYSADEPRTVYSLEVPSIEAGEVLRTTANLEVTNTHKYAVVDSFRILLGSDPTDTGGTPVTPWASVEQTSAMYHWTLPLSGIYHATSSLGTRYLKVILKSRTSSGSLQPSDTLIVQPNFGRLAATRYIPAVGPMSQPTHQLQPLVDPLPLQTSSIPDDSSWQRLLTRKVSGISQGEILDIAAQLQIGKSSGPAVRLESKITYTSAPSSDPTAPTASPLTVDSLAADMSPARIVHSNQMTVSDPSKPYLNLLVRAVPVSGTPKTLTVPTDTVALKVMRMKPNPGDPSEPLREGTRIEQWQDTSPNVSSIPFAVSGGSEKRVVASAPVPDGLWKGEIIHARGLVTGDLNGSGENTQVLTRMIFADSPTDTTGETIGSFSGDKVPSSMQVHTSVKEGVYVMPEAKAVDDWVNFVVYASQANPSGSMDVDAASVSLTRSRPTAPLDESFEDGLNALFRYEYDGYVSTTSTEAREGSTSMQVNVDYPSGPTEPRRVEVRPPDERATAGYDGGQTWHGFSVFFPDGFKAVPEEGSDSGPWLVFTQFHHKDTEGINCDIVGSPPIAFAVRHYEAGAHFNPRETETATPVAGNYLEVSFRGGELNPDCTVPAGDQFVLAPLEHDRWYDFVIHTHWTPYEGTPEASVTEVWMDGEQVLGDESVPITTPTLYWHETPANHNKTNYLQFGLYGAAFDGTHSYIDAVRGGNSYSDVAPGQ